MKNPKNRSQKSFKLKSAALLLRYFKRKKKARPSYSLRALARDLKMSPAYVSQVLSGKRRLSLSRIPALSKVLDLDFAAVELLRRFLVLESATPSGPCDYGMLSHKKTRVREFDLIDRRALSVFKRWYYLAVLDLLTCVNCPSEANELTEWLSIRLGIFKKQALEALTLLADLGLTKTSTSGKITKASRFVRFPTGKSIPEIRGYHARMLAKSRQTLLTKTSDQDFKGRLICGLVSAANLAKIEKAKALLNDALYEAVREISSGDCTELYHLAIQVVPISQNQG